MEKLEDYLQRLDKVVTRFEALKVSPGGVVPPVASAVVSGSLSRSALDSVSAFKQIIDVQVMKAVQVANTISSEGLILPEAYRNEIVGMTNILFKAFEAQAQVVLAMSKCKRPHPAELQTLVQPMVELITEAIERTEGKRTDPFNHQKTVAELVQALTWVGQTAEAGGAVFALSVEDTCVTQSAEFYGNKILKEFRSKDPKHVEWVEDMKGVATALRQYVYKYHLKEPGWKEDGVSVSEFLGTDPPPATPPPVAVPKKEVTPSAPMKATTHWQPDQRKPPPEGDKFAELKKGLRKVGHSPSPKAETTPLAPFQTTKLKSTASPLKQPRMELEMDKKWSVEFFKGNREIVVDQTSAKHTIYIFQCQDSVVQVKGKVNVITIDACKKVGVVFEDVVSLVEVINCSRTDIQCLGRVSTITIDKSDECKVYIPESCSDIGITTAKSSSINLTLTKENADEDPVEHAIPYQFVSTFKDGALVTEPVEHAGAA